MATKQEREWLGKDAPTFVLDSTDGRRLDLGALRGKKVWVAFFRSVSCPLCNLRVRDMTDHYKQLTETCDLQILAIFRSPIQVMTQFPHSYEPPFSLLADPDGKAYDLFDCKTSVTGVCTGAMSGYIRGEFKRSRKLRGSQRVAPEDETSRWIMPADFLIDEEGRVRDAYYGKRVNDHMPFERVLAFSKEHQIGDVKGVDSS